MTIPNLPLLSQAVAAPPPPPQADSLKMREAFDQFVGETFYGQMLSSMRKTLGKPAYFHGGRAEEIFQGQLDQVIGEQLAKASAESFTGPMFELFSLQRS
jgi:flagellar protein FlgJ